MFSSNLTGKREKLFHPGNITADDYCKKEASEHESASLAK